MPAYPIEDIEECLRKVQPEQTILYHTNRRSKGWYFDIKEEYRYDQDGRPVTSCINILASEFIVASISIPTLLGVQEAHRIYEQLERCLKKRQSCLYDHGLIGTIFPELDSDE